MGLFTSMGIQRKVLVGILLTAIAALGAGCEGIGTATIKANDFSVNKEGIRFDHSEWEELLEAYVDEKGLVDYDGFADDREQLDAYLKRVGEVKISDLVDVDERNAFYINAYNAFTVRQVLDTVWEKTFSVRNVEGFWDTKTHLIGGEELTLDQIEKTSRNYGDPRTHFAVNCASIGCPNLQKFAYTGKDLEEQFAKVTKEFLADTEKGVKLDKKNNKLGISSLFNWYAGDFKGETGDIERGISLIKSQFTTSAGVTYIVDKVEPEISDHIKTKNPEVYYLEYDWNLNSQDPPVSEDE